MSLIEFLGSQTGRVVRAGLGVVLIVWGVAAGGAMFALTGVGVILVLVGVFDVCLFAPLMGMPFKGSKLRATRTARHI